MVLAFSIFNITWRNSIGIIHNIRLHGFLLAFLFFCLYVGGGRVRRLQRFVFLGKLFAFGLSSVLGSRGLLGLELSIRILVLFIPFAVEYLRQLCTLGTSYLEARRLITISTRQFLLRRHIGKQQFWRLEHLQIILVSLQDLLACQTLILHFDICCKSWIKALCFPKYWLTEHGLGW